MEAFLDQPQLNPSYRASDRGEEQPVFGSKIVFGIARVNLGSHVFENLEHGEALGLIRSIEAVKVRHDHTGDCPVKNRPEDVLDDRVAGDGSPGNVNQFVMSYAIQVFSPYRAPDYLPLAFEPCPPFGSLPLG
jgi:hypothetical protein